MSKKGNARPSFTLALYSAVEEEMCCPVAFDLFYQTPPRRVFDRDDPFVSMDEDMSLDRYNAALLEFDEVAPGIEMWMKSYQLDGFLMRRFRQLKSDKAIRELSKLWLKTKEEECA